MPPEMQPSCCAAECHACLSMSAPRCSAWLTHGVKVLKRASCPSAFTAWALHTIYPPTRCPARYLPASPHTPDPSVARASLHFSRAQARTYHALLVSQKHRNI